METMVDIARRVAISAHAGQFRRDGVTPYISHPFAVESLLMAESYEIRAAAILHDTMEENPKVTAEYLFLSRIPKDVIDAVVALTHLKGDYRDYLRIVAMNPIARKVKIADMCHNLSCNPTPSQAKRYLAGLDFLLIG